MGSSHGAMARPAVSEPTGVQHKAHLHFTPEGEANLQVPELEVFLDQEGVSFSDRSTWDVLRFVYQIGGLTLARETLHIIRERRAEASKHHKLEPPPDYDEPTVTIRDKFARNSHVSPVRKRRTGQQRPSSSSSESSRNIEFREEMLRQREPEKYTSVPNSPTRLIQPPLRRNSQEEEKEVDDGWTSARTSMDPSSEVPFGRPMSKVWKRPMTSEVHEDLVRALRERSRENLGGADVVQEQRESETTTSLSSIEGPGRS